MGLFSLAKLFGLTLRESATDGSDFTNPDADFRRVFLGEDANLHLKDSAGAVTTVGSTAFDLSGLTTERSVQPITDFAAIYDVSAAANRGVPLGFLVGGRQGGVIFDDCYFAGTTLPFAGGVLIETSGGAVSTASATAANPGLLAATVTTNGQTAGLRQSGASGSILLGGGKVRFGVVMKISSAVSDGTDTYTVRMGLSDAAVGTEATDGVMFRYTHGTNSGEWQGVTRSNTTESVLDTNTAAEITAFHCFEFEINAAASSVEFFIDGASKGTISTNIPSGAGRATSLMPFGVGKAGAGTTARIFAIDAYWLHVELTTAR
jgi:hypothetical protein